MGKGRPSTAPKKLKDGFYVDIANKGANSGIKIRRDTYEEMMAAVKEYEKTNIDYIDEPIAIRLWK